MKKILIAVAVLTLLVPGAFAQLQSSATVPVTVQVSISSTISLTETGGSLTINPATGISNQVTFSATLNLNPGVSAVTLYTWFSSPTAALSAGSTNIASSAIQATSSSAVASGNGFCNASPAVG